MSPQHSAWWPFSGGYPSLTRSQVPSHLLKCLGIHGQPHICGTLLGWCGRPACWRKVCQWLGLCTERPCVWQDKPPGQAAEDLTGLSEERPHQTFLHRWMLCRCGSTGLRRAAGMVWWDFVVLTEGHPDPTFEKWQKKILYLHKNTIQYKVSEIFEKSVCLLLFFFCYCCFFKSSFVSQLYSPVIIHTLQHLHFPPLGLSERQVA